MSKPVLLTSKLVKKFSELGQNLEIIRGLDLQVEAGERVAIIGASGSGKSTLLHLLAGLDQPDSGSVSVSGEVISDLSEKGRARLRNRYLGFVFQFHHLLAEFSALENVAVPMLLSGLDAKEAAKRATVLLDQVGLAARALHKPAKLSGGERQRVAIARALANQPACVLMDEPTGNLDPETANEIEQYLAQLNTEMGTAFVMVTHDHEFAGRMDRVLSLENGVLNAH